MFWFYTIIKAKIARLRQSRIGGDEWEPEGGGELIGQRSQGRSRQVGEGRGRRGRDPEVGKSY